MAATIAANADNATFIACLDERNRQERPVSEQPASRTYAPKVFAEMAESKRIGRARLEAAMDRLFRIAAVERGFVYRDASEGKDRFGIRRRTADLSADLPLTGSADIPLSRYEVEFDMSSLLRSDPETRWASHKIAIETGVLDTDEVREIEGYNPRGKPAETAA